MTANEFTLWLHGYLEALDTEGIEKIKVTTIRDKMSEIKKYALKNNSFPSNF